MQKILLFVKKRWIWIVIIVLILIFVGFRIYSKPKAKKKTFYTVQNQTLQNILALSGFVDARSKAVLHFQTGGRLSWVGVKEGDMVKKYDGIASLDQRQLQKNIEKYLNTYSKERRVFEQSIDDNDNLAIALSQEIRDRANRTLEKSQFDLNNSVLEVEIQSIAKEFSYLYTPIDGLVTKLSVSNPGQNVTATDTFEIIDPESIYFSFSIDQTEVKDVQVGKGGTIVFDSYPDEKLKGVITKVSFKPKEDETGTVYSVDMTIDNKKHNYLLGMTGDVDFVLEEIPNTLVLPLEFLYEESDISYVNKIVGKNTEKTKVKTGKEYGGMVQILSGLEKGDVIGEVEN